MNKNKRKFFLITLAIFLSLFLFYKWQIKTSNYYLDKGNKIYDAKNFNEALKNYKYAAAINGNRNIIYEAKTKRAEIFYSRWQLDKAEEELLQAVKEIKNNYKAYELLGDVYLAKREFGKSIENYNQAIELNNNNKLNIKLAKCFIANQELNLASNTLLDLKNYNNEILYYLGLINLRGDIFYNDYLKNIENSENYKEKIAEIKKFTENYDSKKNSDYNNVTLADLYNKIGEPYFAINEISKTIKNNPSYRDAWIVSGKSNFIIGNYKKSLSDFNRALDLDGNNSEIHFWIASVYSEIGNVLKAEEFFSKYEILKH
jgi:tetratricopeptide (TPR) repeat protein